MRIIILLVGFFCVMQIVNAQNVGIGTTSPNASAKLDVQSSNSGFLPPRMSFSQRNAIVNPAQGLMIYCTDCGTRGQGQIFDGLSWTNLTGGFARGNVSVDSNNNTVNIGTQTWSTKNLDVAHYRNGDPIPQVTDPTQWANLTTGAWCWFNNDSATYGATYGRLYNWYAVNDSRGLAPQGWYVPNVADWDSLFNFFGGVQVAGAQLKSIIGWLAPNNGASNSSGFTGLPGGFRNENGSFLDVGYSGHWWCFDEFDTYSARNRFLYNYFDGVFNNNYYYKTHGFSVRVFRY
jgi:uncharacterized protein (TIGR02145 family)